MIRREQLCLTVLILTISIGPIGCGGNGSGSPGSPPPPAVDFTVAISPSSIYLAPGITQNSTVTVMGTNGFSSPVNVTVAGNPGDVSVSTTAFSISPGGQQQIAFSAANPAANSSATIRITAASGTLSHAAEFALSVSDSLSAPAAHAPIRTRYLRTNAFYDPNSLQYAPPHFSVYDKRDRRFFVSNPFLNRIDVFDAVNEVQINSIPVPGAWGIDISADFGTMYAGTLIGDVYQINPAAMQISRRFPSASIGPAGFEASEAFVMADGKVALLGAMGGLSVDGENSFAVWNPVDNSIDIQGTGGTPNSCIFNMGAFSLTGDRRKVLWGSIDSDGTL